MKLKNLFLSILAGAALAGSCAQEQVISSIAEFKPESSYIGLPVDGGIASTAVEATASWSFDTAGIPDWLTVNPTSGGAGSDYIVFSADPNTGSGDRTANLLVNVGGKQQRFTVVQSGPGAVDAPLSTIAQVAAGSDGEVFRIRGTVTGVRNTNYGNLDMADETGSIYIYGLFNALGQYPKDATGGWSSFGIEPGDVITVQGPRTLYNGTTLELVDASLISVEKSLITIEPSDVSVGYEAGTFTLSVVSKAEGMLVIPSADWVRATDIAAGGNGASVYSFAYDANTTTATRTATIQFKASNSSKSVTVTQEGIPPTGQSVTEIVALEDASGVETLESTVVGKTTKGFVISDGDTAIYVYDSGANAVEVGDVVKVYATKTTYSGVPELATVTAVEKTGTAAVSYPSPKDVTAIATDYAATVAEYIQFTGTLTVSGNYYNITIDGADPDVKMGSIVYPVDALDAKSFDGKSITVTGWFNGLSGSGGKYLNVIATKIAGANAKGTLNNPFSTAEAIAYVNSLGADVTSDSDVYVKGKICSVKYTFSAQYGTATFNISDDGTTSGDQFTAYSAYYLGNRSWTDGDTQIAVGDDVILCGKVILYGGSTPETASKKAYIYSLNGKTE